MGARDTVMSRKELRELREKIREIYPVLSTDREGDIAQATAEVQAERTEAMLKEQWKQAGRKEATDWILDHSIIMHGKESSTFNTAKLQAFLKSKGGK